MLLYHLSLATVQRLRFRTGKTNLQISRATNYSHGPHKSGKKMKLAAILNNKNMRNKIIYNSPIVFTKRCQKNKPSSSRYHHGEAKLARKTWFWWIQVKSEVKRYEWLSVSGLSSKVRWRKNACAMLEKVENRSVFRIWRIQSRVSTIVSMEEMHDSLIFFLSYKTVFQT